MDCDNIHDLSCKQFADLDATCSCEENFSQLLWNYVESRDESPVVVSVEDSSQQSSILHSYFQCCKENVNVLKIEKSAECEFWSLLGMLSMNNILNSSESISSLEMIDSDSSIAIENLGVDYSFSEILNIFWEKDIKLRKARVLLDWLEKKFMEDISNEMDSIDPYLDTTKRLRGDKNNSFGVESLFPDHQFVSGGGKLSKFIDLDKEDAYSQEKIFFLCWKLIQAGDFAKAQKLLVDQSMSWMAGCLQGVQDLSYEDSCEESDFGAGLQCTGNSFRGQYLNICWSFADGLKDITTSQEMTTFGHGKMASVFEKLIMATISCNVEILLNSNQMLDFHQRLWGVVKCYHDFLTNSIFLDYLKKKMSYSPCSLPGCNSRSIQELEDWLKKVKNSGIGDLDILRFDTFMTFMGSWSNPSSVDQFLIRLIGLALGNKEELMEYLQSNWKEDLRCVDEASRATVYRVAVHFLIWLKFSSPFENEVFSDEILEYTIELYVDTILVGSRSEEDKGVIIPPYLCFLSSSRRVVKLSHMAFSWLSSQSSFFDKKLDHSVDSITSRSVLSKKVKALDRSFSQQSVVSGARDLVGSDFLSSTFSWTCLTQELKTFFSKELAQSIHLILIPCLVLTDNIIPNILDVAPSDILRTLPRFQVFNQLLFLQMRNSSSSLFSTNNWFSSINFVDHSISSYSDRCLFAEKIDVEDLIKMEILEFCGESFCADLTKSFSLPEYRYIFESPFIFHCNRLIEHWLTWSVPMATYSLKMFTLKFHNNLNHKNLIKNVLDSKEYSIDYEGSQFEQFKLYEKYLLAMEALSSSYASIENIQRYFEICDFKKLLEFENLARGAHDAMISLLIGEDSTDVPPCLGINEIFENTQRENWRRISLISERITSLLECNDYDDEMATEKLTPTIVEAINHISSSFHSYSEKIFSEKFNIRIEKFRCGTTNFENLQASMLTLAVSLRSMENKYPQHSKEVWEDILLNCSCINSILQQILQECQIQRGLIDLIFSEDLRFSLGCGKFYEDLAHRCTDSSLSTTIRDMASQWYVETIKASEIIVSISPSLQFNHFLERASLEKYLEFINQAMIHGFSINPNLIIR